MEEENSPTIFSDDLLRKIFERIPPSTSSVVSLVCKRWFLVHRSSKSSLKLRLPCRDYPSIPSLSSSLSRYTNLSSLTILFKNYIPEGASLFTDHLLISLASISFNLSYLRLLTGPPFPSSLITFSLSSSSNHLSSLSIMLTRRLSFRWLLSFPSLKNLSVSINSSLCRNSAYLDSDYEDRDLGLECLSLSSITEDDREMGWLWRSCSKLRRLQLTDCNSIGDEGGSFSSFVKCLPNLQEIELKSCWNIADGVLSGLVEHGRNLNSFLLHEYHDDCSHDNLHRFLSNRCSSTIQRLDLLLPFDLENDHLYAVADNLRGLVSIRLESCSKVTGESLKNLGIAMAESLEELSLIRCCVIEREPGLLASLGQNLKRLRKLNLSYNEKLLDKELVSMLVSCNNLIDIQLKGCRSLTNAAIISILDNCKLLESIDIRKCSRIGAMAVENFVLNSPRLSRFLVKEKMLSDSAKKLASRRFIQVSI